MSEVKVQIVVARYNEDVNWLKGATNVIVYNKGDGLSDMNNVVPLPNVGREAHTYLHHIVENYERLADVTLFTQAKISDHGYPENINALKERLITPALQTGSSDNFCRMYKGQRPGADPDFNLKIRKWLIESFNVSPSSVDKIVFSDWFKQFVNPVYPNPLQFYGGAIFAIAKERILTRAKEYYQILLSQLEKENAPIEAHFLERSWLYVFNC